MSYSCSSSFLLCLRYTQRSLRYLLKVKQKLLITLLTFIFHQMKLPSFLASLPFSPFPLWPLSSQIPFLGLPSVFSYSNVKSWSLQIALYHQHKVAVQPALPLRRSQIMSVPSRPSHMDGWALFWCSVCSRLSELPTILLLIPLIKKT